MPGSLLPCGQGSPRRCSCCGCCLDLDLGPLCPQLADTELQRRAVSRQAEHLAGCTQTQTSTCHFVLTSSVEVRALAPNRYRFGSLFCCLFMSFTQSLTNCLSVVHKDVLSTRETPRHGESDRHDPCPQRPYHAIGKREIKPRNIQIMITLVRGARKD